MLALPAHLGHGRPTIFEAYRTDINSRRLFEPWRRLCYTRPNLVGVIAQSQLSQRSFVAAGWDERRALVAYNGFDPEQMQPIRTRNEARAELHLPSDQPLVAYIGHVSRMKGTESLIPVATCLPQVRFLVVGGLPGSADVAWFEDQVRGARANNVRLVSHISPAEVPTYLYAADVLIIPTASAPGSRYHRTVLPMKTFQYLAAGRPIVAPRLPDQEILTDGHDGLLVPPDDPGAAAAAITRVVESPDLRAQLSRAALATSVRFTWRARAERIAAFLEALLV
jgi:glycosyltransferase involved in cell wall biosynthesis